MALKSDHVRFQENYEALLLAYAAGVLDMAQNFIVSAHIALSPRARNIVRECESIGGALLERECRPVAMKQESLHACLSKLDRPERQEPASQKVRLPEDVNLPEYLLHHLTCRPCQPRWRAFYPGLQMCELPLECKQSGVRFIKARPAAKMPHHRHRGLEITLVLNGAYEDETGMHARGDMVVIDETLEHETKACCNNGVVAVVVSDAPVRFSGLAALLNPFIRF